MTTRIRRLEKAYDNLILDMQHDTPHNLDRSELMRGANAQGSTVTYTLHGTAITAPRTTEVDGLKAAAGFEQPEEAPPLISVPDKYKDKRPCTCATHKGNRWQPLIEFSERKARNGKLYPCSWCKRCKADYAADMYYKSKIARGF